MSVFKKLINICISILVCLSLVSCDNFFDSIKTQREAKERENQENTARVTVTFYNSSRESTTPIAVNESQYINSKLITPIKLTSEYTDFFGNSEEKDRYEFNGWVDHEVDPRDTSVEPLPKDYKVTESISLYTCYKIRDIEYEFYSQGLRLEKGVAKYGETIKFKGSNPQRESNNSYKYTFNGWIKGKRNTNDEGIGLNEKDMVASGREKIIFHAVFVKTNVLYTVSWMNGNQEHLVENNYTYESVPKFTWDKPTKDSDGVYSYHFKGWNTTRQTSTNDNTYDDVGKVIDLTSLKVTKDMPLYAVYERKEAEYTVVFYDNDGNSLDVYYGKLGTVPVFSQNTPRKAGSDDKGFFPTDSRIYTFLGWSKDEEATTPDSSLLVNPINDYNKGAPYKFYTVFEKSEPFGTESASMAKLIEDGDLILDKTTGEMKAKGGELFLYKYKNKVLSLYPQDNVTKIPYGGFTGSSNFGDKGDQGNYFDTLKLHEGFTTIGDYSFNFNKNLKYIYLPSTITYTGEQAFFNTSLELLELYVTYDGTKQQFQNINNIGFVTGKVDYKTYVKCSDTNSFVKYPFNS